MTFGLFNTLCHSKLCTTVIIVANDKQHQNRYGNVTSMTNSRNSSYDLMNESMSLIMLPRKPGRNRTIKTKKQVLDNFSVKGHRTGLQPKQIPGENLSKVTIEKLPHDRTNSIRINQQAKLIPVDDVLERIRKFRQDLRSTMRSTSLQTQHFIKKVEEPLSETEPLQENQTSLHSEHEINFSLPKTVSFHNNDHGKEGEHDPDLPQFDVVDFDLNENIARFDDISANHEGNDNIDMISYFDQGLITTNFERSKRLERCSDDSIGDSECHEGLSQNQLHTQSYAGIQQDRDHDNIAIKEPYPMFSEVKGEPRLDRDRNGTEAKPELLSCRVGDDHSYHFTKDIAIGHDYNATVDIGLQHDHELAVQYLEHIFVQTEGVHVVDSPIGNNNLSASFVDTGVGDANLFIQTKTPTIDVGVGEGDLEIQTRDSGSGEGLASFTCTDVGISVSLTSEEIQSVIGIQVGTRDDVQVRDAASNTSPITVQNASINTKPRLYVNQNIGTDIPECNAIRHQATETDPQLAHPISNMSIRSDTNIRHQQESSSILEDRLFFDYSELPWMGIKNSAFEAEIQEIPEEPMFHSSVHDAASQIMSELDNVLLRLRKEVVIADELLQREYVSKFDNACKGNRDPPRTYSSLPSKTDHSFPQKLHFRPGYPLANPEKKKTATDGLDKPDSKKYFERAERRQCDNNTDWSYAVKENKMFNDDRMEKRYRGSNYMDDSDRLLYTIDADKRLNQTDIIKRHIYRHGLHHQHVNHHIQ